MTAVRAALYAFMYCFGTFWIGVISVLLLRWLPYEPAGRWVLIWNRWTIWWAKVCCGLKWEVIGEENIPNEPVVFLSNHESQGETYFLQLQLAPLATVLKQELLDIPFFGTGLRITQPIPIDRGSPKAAMKRMLQVGVERLQQGRNVLIFPQGTRRSYPVELKYARGGSAIAVEAGVKIVPIVHNASRYWPSKGYALKPGTITVIYGEAIDTTGKTPKELTNEVQAWTEEKLKQLHA